MARDAQAELERLLAIMARLRDPDGGCPWDLEQDFDTISPFTIEEAYEVDEAIAQDDPEAICDELGDLLFQVVFQARIAEEKALFDFAAVARAIGDKLVRRHPHVFGDGATPGSARAQSASWEALKAAERAAAEPAGEAPDPFAGIPRRLPALMRSAKIAGRLARLPDEGPRPPDSGAALVEEARAALEALAERIDDSAHAAPDRVTADRAEADSVAPDRAAIRAELGRGLRAWAGLARRLGVDPEQALREADDAVVRRVRGD